MGCLTKRILKEGDILSIDCGVIIDGFYSDAAVTYPLGKVSPETHKLLDVTKASLEKAIEQCQVGGRWAISRCSAGTVRGGGFWSRSRLCWPWNRP